ncbi:glycosyltransferase family 4 protein [Glaciecola sp. MF2-115]|uniref:glycosyltransferase family 4 protein n=1 Tax=Glaciecola sp. MF2-115 TaxID=3384827 RepID=UPI00399F941B
MKSVLIVYNTIQHYREDFFEELGKRYNLTVLHSGEYNLKANNYKQVVAKKLEIGPFTYQFGVVVELFRGNYDSVIFLFNVAWLSNLSGMLFSLAKARTILWGAWYTKSALANKARLIFSKLADANIFYSPCAYRDFTDAGLPKKKAYVANNTFKVITTIHDSEVGRNNLLFVGSLDKRKELCVVLDALSEIKEKLPEGMCFTVIGDGAESAVLKEKVLSLGLTERVAFLGRIQDGQQLETHYLRAFASISYGQAGLSVLQSLGYGVPFITKVNAVSGGEIENIKDGLNGYLVNDKNELKDKILDMATNKALARKLSNQSREYYCTYCTVDNMVQGFCDAIECTNRANVDFSI